VKWPAELSCEVEQNPTLPPGPDERVSGYGVMGLPFRSGHVLGLRRWTASSVGERFTSIWHRNPEERWTFHESAPSEVACTRYFGADVERACLVPIDLQWEDPSSLRITTEDSVVDWTIQIGSSLVTRAMSVVGSSLPLAAWRSELVLKAIGHLAGWALRAGTLKLTGLTSNRQHFDANPTRIWFVTESHARVDGVDLGPSGPLVDQAHMADFFFPQRGIFAIGRVFVTPGAGIERDDASDLTL
jgi:hypothetical protein